MLLMTSDAILAMPESRIHFSITVPRCIGRHTFCGYALTRNYSSQSSREKSYIIPVYFSWDMAETSRQGT